MSQYANSGFFIGYLIFVYVRKIYCLRCMWTKIPLRVQLCVSYYIYVYLFHAGINDARNATKTQFCFRRKKNAWYVTSKYILQPSRYLIIIANRFRYINNNITKDKCPIPMDMTIGLGRHKFSLQATIDHHRTCILVIILPLSTVANKPFYYNDSNITGFDIIDTKTRLLHM